MANADSLRFCLVASHVEFIMNTSEARPLQIPAGIKPIELSVEMVVVMFYFAAVVIKKCSPK
jgi:hypothetical protein